MRRLLFVAVVMTSATLAVYASEGRPNAPPSMILFFHDAHQLAPVVDRHGERGGFARLATLVARERAAYPGTLVLFGGDLAGGTLFGGQFLGLPQVEAFGMLGLSLATFGQHDFDFTSDHTRRLVAASAFPWITSNLIEAGSRTAGAPRGRAFADLPRHALLSAGGLRIGVLGLTDDFGTTLIDGRVEALDLVESARAAVADLAIQRPDAIVALAQTDHATGERLLREVTAIDAVLAEELAEDRSVVTWIGDRPIASPAGNLGTVIRLELTRPDPAGRPVVVMRALPVDSTLKGEPRVQALTDEYEARMEKALGQDVARLGQELSVEGARSGESSLGNLVADAWREACAADIAVVNSGSLRASLPAGTLRRRDAFSVLPFANRLVVRSVSGAGLLAALEHGVRGLAARRGTLLHVSGLRYKVRGPQAPGGRVFDVEVGGQPLAVDASYRVAMSNYLAAGGDGFAWFRADGPAAACSIESGDAEALVRHLRRLGETGIVDAPPSGRLTFAPAGGG